MPAKTRAFAISFTAAVKLEKERVPARTSDVTENAVFSPNAAARIDAADPLTVECPEGYSGCGGVPVVASSNGVQSASTSVAGFPSMSPDRIAVMGRQKT